MRILEVMSVVREQIIKTHCWPANLAGACGLGSYLLGQLIPNAVPCAGHVLTTYHHPDIGDVEHEGTHCWAETPGYVLDVTATQFPRFKDVPLLILPKKSSRDFYKPGYTGREALAYLRTWDPLTYDPDLLVAIHRELHARGIPTVRKNELMIPRNAWWNKPWKYKLYKRSTRMDHYWG